MIRTLVVFALLCFTCADGQAQTELYPTSPVIVDGSDVNFGFEGDWNPIEGLKARGATPNYRLKITREGEGKSYVVGLLGNESASPALQLRVVAVPLASGSGKAIIQIQTKEAANEPYRRIAIAAVNGDVLSVWKLDARHLGQHIFEDGHSAVVEHFHLYTTLRCRPEHLLDTIRRHSDAVVAEADQFRRSASAQQ